MPNQYTTPAVHRKCTYCDTPIRVKPSRAGKHNFCSYECFTEFRRSRREARQCANCGTVVARSASKTHGKSFCSANCQQTFTRGTNHPLWKDGRTIAHGYVFIRTPDRGYVQEHRLVMEEVLGRRLSSTEVVHHRNRNRMDNRPENLEVLSASEHARLHFSVAGWSRKHDHCVECGTTERKHGGHGLCSTCHTRWHRSQGRK